MNEIEPSENPLLNNRSAAAFSRDAERDVIASSQPPVDLRAIPRDQWDRWLLHDVTLPEDVIRYLNGTRLSAPEIQNMEIAVEKYHGVTAPYCIICSPVMQALGRSWAHEEDAGKYLTGFYLDKE